MVVGQDFVWGHLPKAAGDATLRLFRIFPELVTFADDDATNEKHTSFRDRPQQVRGRRRVLNLRRLPDWTLSYTLHKASRGLHPSYRPLPMDSPEQMAASTAPDRYLEAFGPDRIDTWLRVENLVEDFLSFVSGLTDVDAERRRLAHGLPRVNPLGYDREVRHWFTEDQIARLYAANPLWRAAELEVYGAAGGRFRKAALIRRLRRGPSPGGARRPRAGGSAPRARGTPGIGQDQIVWIFGFARTGSSWLARMMTEPRGYAEWNEPQVGEMLGSFYYLRYPHRRNATFLLGDKHRDTWEEAIRQLVLSGAEARYPDAERIVVKEPHGSIGAPLLTGALPESRLVLLLRDPRDMVASALDAQRSGSWAAESRKGGGSGQAPTQADTDPDAFVRGRAERLVDHVTRAREAYDAHGGPRSFVRYERLREDPAPTLARIFDELGLDLDHAVAQGAVDAQAWEQIPAEDKGEGKRYRRAEPGGWSEDLTPAQARAVERITAPALGDLYG